MNRKAKNFISRILKTKGRSVNSQSDISHSIQNALAFHQNGQLERAESLYKLLLANEPVNSDVYHLLGIIAYQRGNHYQAIDLIRKAIQINPEVPSYYSNCGIALKELKLFNDAIASYDLAIKLNPEYAEAYYNKGNALQEIHQFSEALTNYEKAISINSNYAAAYSNRGITLNHLSQFQDAIRSFDKAIELESNYPAPYSNRGIALQNLGRFEDAVNSFDLAIVLKPDYPEAYSNRGVSLQNLKQFEVAIESYQKAILFNPEFSEAYFNLGNAQQEQENFESSIISYNKAIELNNVNIQAYYNLGISFQKLKRFNEAISFYNKAIQLHPKFAEAYLNKANVLRELGQYDAANHCLDLLLKINPNMVEALLNKASLYLETKKFRETVSICDQLLDLKASYEYVLGIKQEAQMHICDWQDFYLNINKISHGILNNEQTSLPFYVLAQTDSLIIQKQAAQLWVAYKYPSISILGNINKYLKHQRIRVGYYSADFHNHATAYLIAELFELHDKNKFEVFAFSYGPDTKDEMQERIAKSVDHFIEVSTISDISIAQMSRQLEVDIAIDLKGLTQHNRLGIFAHRAAPVQVSYLGYPGTLSASYIDYLIADKTLIPQHIQNHYCEKIVYLPHSYQVNDRKRFISPKKFNKDEVGLPENCFVFCCFNNNFKITPSTFDSWINIIQKVPQSVLWLLEDNATAATNLRKEAKLRGLDPSRLVFATRMSLPDHLARQRLADLFLDTLPYNAHTTASDALWAGLPVLTCKGESFASRVAASLLNAIGLPEMVTDTRSQFEAMAIELATNPLKLQTIRHKLQINRLHAPLFDTPLFIKNIEAAYFKMYQRYHCDSPLEHIQSFELKQ